MSYMFIVGGLVLLFCGGEAVVRGSVGVARKLGVSELVIGLTLVGFGTSAPELVTSLKAVSKGAVGMSVGNVAGSNIANILLVMGIAALIRPIVTKPSALTRDFTVMVFATLVFAALAYYDIFTRPAGGILVTLLILYIASSFLLDKSNEDAAMMHADEGELIETNDPLPLALVLAFGGIAGVVFGAELLVNGGIDVAERFGVSDTLIGLTFVAIGTSLPEVATVGMSAIRGKSDVALGTVLGSNIFNIFGIIGVTALVHPFSLFAPPAGGHGESSGVSSGSFDYSEVLTQGSTALSSGHSLSWTDISTIILSVFLIIIFAFTGRQLARWEGAILLGSYGLYMGFLFNLVPTPFA
ncbi:MAG: calcium/sodium antiporter [Pseudomonadota bacterium]